MRLTNWCLLAVAANLVRVESKGSPFKGNINVPVAQCVGNNGNTSPSLRALAANAQVATKCDKDVKELERKNKGQPNGQQSRVQNVDKVSLNCTELTANMPTVDFYVNKDYYTATKKTYTYDNVLQRNIWVGELDGLAGFVNIVWNNACDRDVFMFEVTLPTTKAGRNRINAVPCSLDDGSTNDCMWLAHVNMDAISEQEDVDPNHRHLHEAPVVHTPEEEAENRAKDADIELLRKLLEGEGDAADIFHAGGGRKLAVENPETGTISHQYVMPSGRRLDDGSVIRVLWLYTPAVAAAKGGDSAVISALSSALVTSNAALKNSGVTLTFEIASIQRVVYTEVSHAQSLSDLANNVIANVNTWRDLYAADVTQMIINSTEWCGLAYMMTPASSGFAVSAFSTVYWDCLSYYSSPHEIGHNIGLDHDMDASGTTGTNHGYKWCTTPNLRSIMSYACTTGTATRMPLFSSPTVYYSNGVTPTGDANNDNATILRNNKYIVSNFRTGSGTLWTIPPTPVPTKAPTAAPTTKAPVVTAAPTTKAPTSAPTTGAPVVTAAPTTKAPVATAAPTTVKPTTAPTAAPTVKPTVAPTVKPTAAPTVAGTHVLVIKTIATSAAENQLNLADVNIIGASSVTATLSDTYATAYAAMYCIDTGSTKLTTFCNSATGGASLTLTYMGTATSVVVTNRADGWQDRINGATMTLDGKLVYTFPSVSALTYTITLPTSAPTPLSTVAPTTVKPTTAPTAAQTTVKPTTAPTAAATTVKPTTAVVDVTTPHTLVIKTSTATYTDAYLHPADVQIIGGYNVVATLSDTLSGYPASNCIDTGSTYLSTFCHSASVGGSLTLTYTGAATSVVVTNRQDCCQYRLNSATITLDGKVVYTFPTVSAASYNITLPAADVLAGTSEPAPAPTSKKSATISPTASVTSFV